MSDLDFLADFRPQMGRGHRASSRSASGSLHHDLLSALRGRSWRGGRKISARSRVAVPRSGPGARRVIVKASFVRMSAGGAKAAALHLRYIERDGVEKDGSKGLLYTAQGAGRAEDFEQPRRGEEHQFRLIVSPEDAGELELTDYVRRLMGAVERDIDRKLEWAAVNHFDTEHPHAHVIVRGVDRDGREVRFDRGYISNGLRWRAQELATLELGLRREVDVRRARAKEVGQERFTSLDREIERRIKDDRVEARSPGSTGGLDESVLIARLKHLERLRLAERVGPVSWSLSPGWKEELRELGTRADILKQIHRAVDGEPSRYRAVRPGEALGVGAGKKLVGRVAGMGLADEVKGAFYAVVETPGGDAFHLRLDARTAEAVRTGDLVVFGSGPEPAVRSVDRRIAELARAHGGNPSSTLPLPGMTARASCAGWASSSGTVLCLPWLPIGGACPGI